MVSDLVFEVPVQKIIFRNFLQFIGSLGLPIEVSFANNKAYFNLENQNIALSVFPYRNEGIHFEFTRDLSNPFNTQQAIPVYVNTPDELEIVKPAIKVLFITKSATNTVAESKPQEIKSTASKPGPVIHRERPDTTNAVTTTKPVMNRVIDKFFE